jgi:hypothetical protein
MPLPIMVDLHRFPDESDEENGGKLGLQRLPRQSKAPFHNTSIKTRENFSNVSFQN